ncbi:TPA: hypothetical protein PAP86_001458 [Salmonella enterica]|nr:hypothetical protein [Salmonella enterica]
MGIYIKSPPPEPQTPDINPQMVAGRAGAFPVGEMQTIDDMDTAPTGPHVVRKGGSPDYPKGTKNIPAGANPYGIIVTISSKGTGADGKRRITNPLADDEFVYQLFFDTWLQLFARRGYGKAGFTAWEKKTPKL